jgi:hypothetical protein
MSPDPYDFYKSLFNAWQKPAAEFWDAYLRSPLYLEPLKRMLDISLESQKNLQDMSETWWHAWGLPTRRDQELTQHRLNEVDTQLKRLARRVDKLAK